MKKLLLAVAALGAATSLASAQTSTSFADLDTDQNGELSFAEVTVVWTTMTEADFAAADADQSGGLSADEISAVQGAAAAPPAAPADGAAPDASTMTPAPAPAPADTLPATPQ